MLDLNSGLGPESNDDTFTRSTFGARTNDGIKYAAPDAIRFSDIKDLLQGRLTALIIPQFVEGGTAASVAAELERIPLRSQYKNLRDPLLKIGNTLFEAVVEPGSDASISSSGAQALQRYFENAAMMRQLIRQTCEGGGDAPFDRATELLKSIGDAEILTLADRPAFAGLIRILTDGQQILPHQDYFGEDLPQNPFALELARDGAGQLAGNIYLQMPSDGGELVIWKRSFSPAERRALRAHGSDYGADRARLAQPDAVIRPAPGDLILFNSEVLHGVERVKGGNRVSISFFIGVTADGKMRYWS